MPFTHLDANGSAIMVDVSEKRVSARLAVACGRIRMSAECFRAITEGSVPKGDALAVARVAGIMAAKRTSELIPLCHSLPLTSCTVDFIPHAEACELETVCAVRCAGKTGVEMEALTGASIALLTIYDMCKALDRRMVISSVHLLEKHGGRSGDFYYNVRDGANA